MQKYWFTPYFFVQAVILSCNLYKWSWAIYLQVFQRSFKVFLWTFSFIFSIIICSHFVVASMKNAKDKTVWPKRKKSTADKWYLKVKKNQHQWQQHQEGTQEVRKILRAAGGSWKAVRSEAAINPKLGEWLQQIPGTTSEISIRKSIVLETAEMQRRTLKLPGWLQLARRYCQQERPFDHH